jgi:ubiquinone/menaquinone biosynthesis C-methylase UbiE
MNDKNRVCPVELSGSLDNWVRRLLHNPRKILSPYCKPGMTAMDVGCGPGFFTVEMARMVGASGHVIAFDLQDGMLDKAHAKIKGTQFEPIITLNKCKEDRIGVSEPVDFALAFYMVHEVPDRKDFFAEICSVLKPDGKFLVVEPPFHVSKSGFKETVDVAVTAGLVAVESPKVFFGRTMVFKKAVKN